MAQPLAFGDELVALREGRVDLLDLGELEVEQVKLALARPGQLAQLPELLARAGDRRVGRGAGGDARGLLVAGATVEDLELCRGQHQPPVLVLAVEAEHRPRQLAQLADRDRTPAEIGARAPVGADPPRQHQLGRVGREMLVLESLRQLEDPLDVGLGRARPHDPGARTAAEQQVEGARQHGLAGARLARDHVEAGSELEARVLDQQQVLDGQLVKHLRQVYQRTGTERDRAPGSRRAAEDGTLRAGRGRRRAGDVPPRSAAAGRRANWHSPRRADRASTAAGRAPFSVAFAGREQEV